MRSRKATEEAIRTRLNFTFDPPLRGQLLARALREQEQSQEMEPAHPGPVIRRMIMRRPMTRLAAAAAIVLAVGTGFVGIWHSGGSAAYAFAQTVEAMQGKRSFHIQTYFQQRRKDEFWAEFDKQGSLIRFRQEEDGGRDGPLITIWENGILNRYRARGGVHQWSRLENETGLEGLEEFDPETIVQEINALVEAGKAEIEIDGLARYARLMTLRVTRKDKDLEQVLVVDPATKFVVRVDDYWGTEGGGTVHKGIEVLEYNEAMDPGLFAPEVPEDAVLMDQMTQEVGLAQGDRTEKEVAAEVVRQALEAWAQGDYAKVGKLFGGVPPQSSAEADGMRPTRILFIGEAELIDNGRPPYGVRCLYETKRDGRKKIIALTLAVHVVDGQPGRWHVAIVARADLPADVEHLDIGGTDLGLVQGQLTDEEVATAVVRQFFEAVMTGDDDAAGRLVPPGGTEEVKEHFSDVKILRILSVGPATPLPSRENKTIVVPCAIEYEQDGMKNSMTIWGLVVQQADRWILQDLKD